MAYREPNVQQKGADLGAAPLKIVPKKLHSCDIDPKK
jgi:hypothetical protein